MSIGRILLVTALFWAVWVGIAGLAMVVHGDCGIGTTDAEATACIREKGWVGIVVVAIGAVVYAIIIWMMARRARPRDEQG